jgi:hypothetical protein
MSSPEHGEEIRAEIQRRFAASAHPYDAFNTVMMKATAIGRVRLR